MLLWPSKAGFILLGLGWWRGGLNSGPHHVGSHALLPDWRRLLVIPRVAGGLWILKGLSAYSRRPPLLGH